MSNILITGASGFIGRHLTIHLQNSGHHVFIGGRDSGVSPAGQETLAVRRFNLLDDRFSDDGLFDSIDTVIHLAGLAHKPSTTAAEYKRVNADASGRLALAAARQGVRRFVLMSTVKVHGESSPMKNGLFTALTEDSALAPGDDYSASKLEAERILQDVCSRYDMEYVILRPPLVYGPGVRANFLSLLRAVTGHWPLPMAGIQNRRSMIYVGNLCHIVVGLINGAISSNQVYLVRDMDLSTPELINRLAEASATRALLFPVPDRLLIALGRVVNCPEMIDRLRQSLLIDDAKLRAHLDWQPPIPIENAIEETVGWYLTTRH